MSYDAAMKQALVRAAFAAAVVLALGAVARAQDTNTGTTTAIKGDAKNAGHAVAQGARSVGHSVADASRQVGHAVSHSAKAVGAKVKEEAGKAKHSMSGKPDESPRAIAIVLEHGDPALSLPLFSSPETDDIVAEWQSWGRALGLPLLVADRDGSLREPFARLGAVRIEAPTWRRRRRSAMARRRPQRLLRRRPGATAATPFVHRGEREIIARN